LGRDLFEDLDMERRIMLKYILMFLRERDSNDFNWTEVVQDRGVK
jgi:hypothetical protein